MRSADVRDKLASQGAVLSPTSPEEFAASIDDGRERWGKVIRDNSAILPMARKVYGSMIAVRCSV